jgi:hypothetical protein
MTLGIEASDITRQRSVRAPAVSGDMTVTELVKGFLASLNLTRTDPSGRPVQYRARLDRENRHLNGGERVGEALREGDHVVLQPSINAGAPQGG